MNEDNQEIVYSAPVIEFVAVANEFCTLLENAPQFSRAGFIEKATKILPLMYVKFLIIPPIENIFEEGNERFITEDDWIILRENLLKKMGPFDAYPEVFDERMTEADNFVTSNVSEQLADIYQDIKDFLLLYQMGTNEIMNDAIWECQENFRQYWGQKLVNVQRALHNVFFSDNDFTETPEEKPRINNIDDVDTSSWLINKRFEDFKNGEDK
ncbi:MAG: DUF5063 domain-containing protein [Bacteroidota bacterium]